VAKRARSARLFDYHSIPLRGVKILCGAGGDATGVERYHCPAWCLKCVSGISDTNLPTGFGVLQFETGALPLWGFW